MDDNRLETIITHVTGIMFAILSITTWMLRWLVASWTARARVMPAAA